MGYDVSTTVVAVVVIAPTVSANDKSVSFDMVATTYATVFLYASFLDLNRDVQSDDTKLFEYDFVFVIRSFARVSGSHFTYGSTGKSSTSYYSC